MRLHCLTLLEYKNEIFVVAKLYTIESTSKFSVNKK